jgi:hypothetical protein
MSLGDVMKVVLISALILSKNEIALPVSKGQLERDARLPSHLPEHPSVGIGTLAQSCVRTRNLPAFDD